MSPDAIRAAALLVINNAACFGLGLLVALLM